MIDLASLPPERILYNDIAPFKKVMAIDYYDGPLSGLAMGCDSNSAYRFKVVAWDDGQDVRLYVLSSIPVDVYESFESHLIQHGAKPRCPFWLPSWNFADEAGREELDSKWQSIAGAAFQPELYVLATDLMGDVIMLTVFENDVPMVLSAIENDEIGSIQEWIQKLAA